MVVSTRYRESVPWGGRAATVHILRICGSCGHYRRCLTNQTFCPPYSLAYRHLIKALKEEDLIELKKMRDGGWGIEDFCEICRYHCKVSMEEHKSFIGVCGAMHIAATVPCETWVDRPHTMFMQPFRTAMECSPRYPERAQCILDAVLIGKRGRSEILLYLHSRGHPISMGGFDNLIHKLVWAGSIGRETVLGDYNSKTGSRVKHWEYYPIPGLTRILACIVRGVKFPEQPQEMKAK